jgi:hypothetical protein
VLQTASGKMIFGKIDEAPPLTAQKPEPLRVTTEIREVPG